MARMTIHDREAQMTTNDARSVNDAKRMTP